MLLNYEDVSPVKKIVEVEIPADLISAEAKRVTADFSRQANVPGFRPGKVPTGIVRTDRKSTRLNSSHPSISYAVFCLKKKKNDLYLESFDLVDKQHNGLDSSGRLAHS